MIEHELDGTNDRIRLRAAALIHNSGKLLLVEHRHAERGDTSWTFPGGGVMGVESLEECLKRDVREHVISYPGEPLRTSLSVAQRFYTAM